MLSRRSFLRLAAGSTVAVAVGPLLPRAAGAAVQQVMVTGTATNIGQYLELPFDVPAGVNRIDVKILTAGDAVIGCGLFDQRGAGYQAPGFRGIYGEERKEFFVAPHEASQSFLPGPIDPGRWTVLIPVFRTTRPTQVTADVTLTFGPSLPTPPFGPEPGVVREGAAWYRGDLHCHTPESSDAFNSKTALTPSRWAAECRRIGLDFAAMTDHNVISQNLDLGAAAGDGVLLLAGEEMTNWFHGHATVSGIKPGEWLDWRQTPLNLPLPSGRARITEFLAIAREMGAYVAAAHPLGATLAWEFFADADVDPKALPEGLEVWTGSFQPDDEAAVRVWDDYLRRGYRVWANGGSDLHGVVNTQGFFIGTPTTVVFAPRLAKADIVTALKNGRSFVTRKADGVEVYLSAKGKQDQRDIVGGEIFGNETDTVEITALVRKGNGMRLILLRDGAPFSVTALTRDDQEVTVAVPIGPGGYVRAEVRGVPFIDPTQPLGGRLDMEALTNPIFLRRGAVPAGRAPVVADPPPASAAPGPGAPPPPPSSTGTTGSSAAPRMPDTGGGVGALGAVGAVVAGIVAMTLTEVVHRAGSGTTLDGVVVQVVGEVTAVGNDGAVTVTRWVPACCAQHDKAVDVQVSGVADVAVGDWIEVEGRWQPGSGAAFADNPALRATAYRRVDHPPPRREAE